MPAARPPSHVTTAEQIQADRASDVWQLRISGHSYRQIADILQMPLPSVYKRVKAIQNELNEHTRETAAQMRDMETARLDEMVRALWPQALAGKAHVIDRVLAIMQRRAALYGLDAPPRAAVDSEGQVVREYVGVPVPVLVSGPMQLAEATDQPADIIDLDTPATGRTT